MEKEQKLLIEKLHTIRKTATNKQFGKRAE